MLVLTRKSGDGVIIDGLGRAAGLVKVTVLEIRGRKVKLGIEADMSIAIRRREVLDRTTGRIRTASTALAAVGRPGEA